jgi:hypothetical protein
MGMLYDLGERVGAWNIDDTDRPLPPKVDVHREFYLHDHPGREGLITSYASTLWDRPEVDLVAGSDRDQKRLKIFNERYGIEALYTDAAEMLRNESLDIVAITTNIKGRADLTCLAVESGAKGILTEKPMTNTLEEADRMVKSCADAGVPLCVGAVYANHPSFAKAKELVASGAIGDLLSIEVDGPGSQGPGWTYFLDSAPAWLVGTGDKERREGGRGSDEFMGQGMMVTRDGSVVHFRKGAPSLRISGTGGEIFYYYPVNQGFNLWQVVDTPDGQRRVHMPWPEPNYVRGMAAVYGLSDVIDCMEGRLDEPKSSGRRVAVGLEVEIALKQSAAQGGAQVSLPLKDRSLRLNYDLFR